MPLKLCCYLSSDPAVAENYYAPHRSLKVTRLEHRPDSPAEKEKSYEKQYAKICELESRKIKASQIVNREQKKNKNCYGQDQLRRHRRHEPTLPKPIEFHGRKQYRPERAHAQ